MSSSSQSSSPLPVHNCTAPLLDSDLQEKLLLLHATEGKTYVPPGEAGKLCSMIRTYKKDYHRTAKAIQDGKHFTDLSKESGGLEHQLNSKNIDTLMQKLSENETRNTTLEKKIAEWKLQVGEYKHQMLALRETSEQKKTALKKAIRSQKRRAERFEAAVENLTSRIRERVSDYAEVKLSEILSASDVWKNQHDRMVEGKTTLEIQTEDLKNIDTISLAVFTYLSLKIIDKRKDLILTLKYNQCALSVQKLQTAVEELKSRYETVLNENKRITENKCLEVDKLRDKMEAELKDLEHVCDLLKAAEEKQQRYQEKLMSWERIHAQKCKTLRELQVQVSSTRNELSFSQEEDSVTSVGSHSLEEENRNIQKKYEDLKRQLEKMEFQNEELACQLKKEDESLQFSKLQLEEKIAEYNGLTRQLDSAMEEGRKMVAEELEKMSYKEQALQAKMLILETEVRERQEEKKQLLCIFHHLEEKIAEYNGLTRQLDSAMEEGRKMVAEELEKMSYKEQALQAKMLILETEVRERQEEKKQLLCIFHHNEKHREVRLKELENSLQKSENKNQSIQNYVRFLKASYITMFG
ncbi:PREDICTED: outer dense fiber protein 2-like [Aptenodytes forsteri]|uniref:outer dense fiber protein 2-like n=1 Tax=Aptenodytes forsteri TaxID=9233 RepID=UPI0004F40D2B|nr:PREDICTED: outer dense fiber protein 2-like [Aptenodytes forsteri]